MKCQNEPEHDPSSWDTGANVHLFSHMSESREAHTWYQVVHLADNRCKHANTHELKVVANIILYDFFDDL